GVGSPPGPTALGFVAISFPASSRGLCSRSLLLGGRRGRGIVGRLLLLCRLGLRALSAASGRGRSAALRAAGLRAGAGGRLRAGAVTGDRLGRHALLELVLALLGALDVEALGGVDGEAGGDAGLRGLAGELLRESAVLDLGEDLGRGHRLALAVEHLDHRPHDRALARPLRLGSQLVGLAVLAGAGGAHGVSLIDWVRTTTASVAGDLNVRSATTSDG